MDQELNVLYQFNEAYVQFAGTSIVSLFENNQDISKITVYVLEEKLSENSIKMLNETAADYQREINFINTDTIVEKMKQLGIPKYRGSYTTNMKLFLSDVIKDSVRRILYLDSDTAVIGSLKELIKWDMQGKPVAMVLDSLGKSHALKIGHNKQDNYFNGGVILFDLIKWNAMNCTERIISHVQNVRSHYMAPDQDLMNVVLKGEIAKLPAEYGLQPFHYIYSPSKYFRFFKSENYYAAHELEHAAKSPLIIHYFRFLGEFPWHKDTAHPYKKFYDYYSNYSRWKDYERVPSEHNGIIFKIEKALFKYLPGVMFLAIFKANYEFFLWRCERDSLKGKNNADM